MIAVEGGMMNWTAWWQTHGAAIAGYSVLACLGGFAILQHRVADLYIAYCREVRGEEPLKPGAWWENRLRRRDMVWQLFMHKPISQDMGPELRLWVIWLRIVGGVIFVAMLGFLVTVFYHLFLIDYLT